MRWSAADASVPSMWNLEVLAIEIDLNIPVQLVVRVLDRVVANRGYPLKIRMDNGPELVSQMLAQWAEDHGVVLEFILPYSIGVTGMFAVQSAWIVELFGAQTRLAAITSSKALGALTSGGIAPVICAALLVAYGDLWVIGGYMMLLSLVSIVAAVILPETAGRDLVDDNDAIFKLKKTRREAKEFNLS